MIRFALLWIFLSLVILKAHSVDKKKVPTPKTSSADIETVLYNKLFNGSTPSYNRLFRPQNSTVVEFSLSLASIVNLNEKEGYLTTTFIPRMLWKDPRLTWNRSDQFKYNDHLQVPASDVWLPDLEVLNRYRDSAHDNAMKPLVWLHSSGTVFYVPRRTYQTPCNFNLESFPYDTQVCDIVLGSWAYSQHEVDFSLIANGTDLQFYVSHSDFELINFNISRVETFYGAEPNTVPFVELFVNLTLRRRPKFFYYAYMLPADLLLFTLPLVHLIPPQREGRLILLAAVFICTTLMMSILADFMPGYYAAGPPKPLRLYVGCLAMALISAVVNCFTMSLATIDSKTGRVPLILQKVLLRRLAVVCCVFTSSPSAQFDYQLLRLEKLIQSADDPGSQGRELIPQGHSGEDGDHAGSSLTESHREEPPSGGGGVTTALHHLVSELQLSRYREQVKAEWLQLSLVLDRFFALVLFIVAICFLSLNR